MPEVNLGITEKEFLSQYEPESYSRPSVTDDMLLFTAVDAAEDVTVRELPVKELKVLLVKRGEHPDLGKWALPGGFVKLDENLDSAAERKLREETGIDSIYMEQLYTWGDVGRDPRTRVISVAYMALVDSEKVNIQTGTSIVEARWFTVVARVERVERINTSQGFDLVKDIKLTLTSRDSELAATVRVEKKRIGKTIRIVREIIDNNGMAFDHPKIIEYGIERLRNKLWYTDIAFNLMPEEFTLTQLQRVYEAILGKELLLQNFRPKIEHMVKKTGKKIKIGAFRPAECYSFNPEWEFEGV